ncbi:glycogen synthase GlgA [Thiomicrorhabdus lithotrophica]|uniref:Glycogen synthase n=1 Tax=Thiomicrorhabdus lithotrophica TaxID=2949997 RepID=A0ABY8CEA8_9GAMM|nr:glycogen synthase GlgA [Thiomicrorhabdus lithotrophica]WEJ63127.1 glycogen synthase GlgA [Thiomicrorhabdus lithotrophica]
MKILFASSEAHPFIKTGGLADVSGSLPNALVALKHKVRLVLPAYQAVLKKLPAKEIKKVAEVSVSGCGKTYSAQVLQVKVGAVKGIDFPVWLVDIPELFDRPGNPYLAADGTDWWDNGERFAIFSMVVNELAMNRAGLKWQPDVVHANDWQTGLVPALLSLEEDAPKTVFTIHNMAYPGNFPKSLFDSLRLPWQLWGMEGAEFYGHFSMLKAGLIKADWVSTVSPTYAKEICFPEFAYGLEGVLQKREIEGRLTGIINGIDEHVWNPATDNLIVQNYSAKKGRIAGKLANKKALLSELCILRGEKEKKSLERLSSCMDKPLIGLVGRLVEQKGMDLVLEIMPELIQQTNANFVIVGTGDKVFEAQVRTLSQKYPHRVWAFIGYSESLAHRVEAGADMFLMPSRFEPCGLNQMYSLAYGTPPIVHHTGGLADSVVNATDENIKAGTATGFVFYDPSRHALKSTILHALHLFGKRRTWQKIQKTGMELSLDWKHSAKKYIELYSEIK